MLRTKKSFFYLVILAVFFLIGAIFLLIKNHIIPFNSQKNEERTITVVTETIPGGYTASLDNNALFEDKLESLGFYNVSGVGIHDGKNVTWVSGGNLSIIFSGEKQAWPGIVSGKKQVELSSFNLNMDEKGVAVLRIAIAPEATTDQNKMSLLINRTVFTALYKVTHWTNGEDDKYFSYMESIDQELNAKDISQRPFIISL